MSDSLSILDIEAGLAEVLAAREEVETPEDVAAADAAISAYLSAEVAKADGIARAVRQWNAMAAADKAEASRLRARSAALEARVARLKEFVRFAMERRGVRRIEGKLSTLRLQAAGGKQGVDVHNDILLPDELCMAEITMSYEMWCRVEKEFFGGTSSKWGVFIKRVPRLTAIAEALQEPCPRCGGDRAFRAEEQLDGECSEVQCPACGGSGKQGVPGASLRPRADIVVIA